MQRTASATGAVPAYFCDLGRLRMLGGHRALDLANTAHWRDGHHVDFVPDYASLLHWADPAGFLAGEEVEALLLAQQTRPDAASAIHREWAQLRAVFRVWLRDRVGPDTREASGHAQSDLTACLNNTLASLRLKETSTGIAIVDSAEALATPLIRSTFAIAELVSLPPRGTIRLCEGDPCGGFFLDESRSKPRRWCSMDTCGNRHKVRRFRAREADSAGERS